MLISVEQWLPKVEYEYDSTSANISNQMLQFMNKIYGIGMETKPKSIWIEIENKIFG